MKFDITTNSEEYTWSLPTRERGLKFDYIAGRVKGKWSLPTRERGLKFYSRKATLELLVAPYAGAWVEICGTSAMTHMI